MTVTIEEAQRRLPELIAGLKAGEELTITDQDLAVARLVAAGEPRRPGSAAGMLTILTEDDEHLKDFAEYMP